MTSECVAEMSDDVVVMYAGGVMEQASRRTLFYLHHHPYTEGLLGSLPAQGSGVERLTPIPGTPPSLIEPPRRVPLRAPVSARLRPVLARAPAARAESTVDESHQSACWLPHARTYSGVTAHNGAGGGFHAVEGE